MTHASRDHWKDATASLHQTILAILGTRRDGIFRNAPMPKANTSPNVRDISPEYTPLVQSYNCSLN